MLNSVYSAVDGADGVQWVDDYQGYMRFSKWFLWNGNIISLENKNKIIYSYYVK